MEHAHRHSDIQIINFFGDDTPIFLTRREYIECEIRQRVCTHDVKDLG